MRLNEVKDVWNDLGTRDPLWAILSENGKENGQWNKEEFFGRGAADVEFMLQQIADSGFEVRRGRALDFGCGVGRLTQSLCQHFNEVDGVDIADSMISLARTYNQWGQRCRYHVNHESNLGLFGDGCFDYLYSNIVLQHIPPEYSQVYIKEFCRILSPGGIAAFQLPHGIRVSPLPPEAFHASIRLVGGNLSGKPGETIKLEVAVTNDSRVLWPCLNTSMGATDIKLGNHWLSTQGLMLVQDDGRVSLPDDLAPGASVTLPLHVWVPEGGHDLRLQLDLVQENVGWFGNLGSTTLQHDFSVTASSPGPFWRRFIRRGASAEKTQATPSKSKASSFAMFGVPKERVIAIIEANNCELVRLLPSIAAGPQWEDYWYIVRRRN